MKKLTFRKCKSARGLLAVGSPYPNTVIKRDGKMVGLIKAPSWSTTNEWRIMFMVNKPSGENCDWSWITLNHRTATEDEAREFIKKKDKEIQEKFSLREDIDDYE